MNIDIILLPGILITGLVLFIYILTQAVKKPVIVYYLTQLTVVWIFFGQNILNPMGLDFKPHAMVFMLAAMTAIYFIYKNFDYLWSYAPFRYLFIFFLISTVYAVCYKTDFRSSSYIDLWIHNNIGLKHSAIGAGHGAIGREFGSGETKFIVYLAGLVPIVAFMSGLMAFFPRRLAAEGNPEALYSNPEQSEGSSRNEKLQDSLVTRLPQNDAKELMPQVEMTKLQNLISFFSFGILGYFILKALAIITGNSTIMFMEGRLAIDGGFTGGDFEGLLLILLAGFYLYLQQNKDFKLYEPTKWGLIANMIILSLLIILGIKKGTILSLFFAAHLPVYLILAVKLYYRDKIPFKFNPVMTIVPITVICMLMLFAPSFVDSTMDSINERFASNDTLQVRQINWDLYNQHWANNLSLSKALFGFGIDSSREAAFFLSAMHPDPSFQQPHIHNIYLEMFYNYGLVAILFFLPILLIFMSNLRRVLSNNYNIFDCLSLTAIAFFLIYFMTESPAVPSLITFFSLIGFFESIRRINYEQKEKSPVFN